MQTPRWSAGDFDTGITDLLGFLNEAADQATRAFCRPAGSGSGAHAGGAGGARGTGAGGARGTGAGGTRGTGAGGTRAEGTEAGSGPRERGFSAHWERGFGGRGHWGGGAGSWGNWWPGPQAAQRNSKAGRGDVRAAILALLREGPRTGYQIMSDIKERSGGAWRPSPGAVYPALSQLADEGLIEGEESGGRRTFSLTEDGLRYVEQHPDRARAAWESQAQQDAWELPGLLSEAARLGGGIMQVAHAGSPAQVHAAEQLLQRTRRELYQILADDFHTDEPDDDADSSDDVADEHPE